MDELDIKILGLLEKDGRMHYNDISHRIGLRPPSVIGRIKKMEEEGIIRGYTVLIDDKKVGMDITGFIGVNIDHPRNIGVFEKEIKRFGDEILECHHVTGEYTLILKVKTKNTLTLEKLIKKIRSAKGVERTYTMIVFSTIKENPVVSVECIRNFATMDGLSTSSGNRGKNGQYKRSRENEGRRQQEERR